MQTDVRCGKLIIRNGWVICPVCGKPLTVGVLHRVMALADRILVMFEGEIVGELDPKTTTAEQLGLYMSGAKREGVKS